MYDTIYIAYLQGGRMYVGHTDNFKQRKWEHFNGLGSKVTKKYPPIYIKKIKTVPHKYGKLEELKLVRKLISRYGKKKVRGGYLEKAFNF